MPRFHELTVTDVRKTIREAVVVTLAPEDGADFGFVPGQYLTFRRDFDGTEIRRNYSICAGRNEGVIQVGIKKVEGGAFSTWANEELKPGMTMEAMPPAGSFHMPIGPGRAGNYLGFAGGSGITPVLSILKTVLDEEPDSTFTLVYANKGVNTIMFREEIEGLKNTHMGRFNIIHVLETDAQEIDLFTGRIDAAKCRELLEGWIDIDSVDTVFICGPEPMMQAIASALGDQGVSEDRIKIERFTPSQPGRLERTKPIRKGKAKGTKATKVTVSLDGASRSFEVDEGKTILESALENSIDAPYACRAGVCSTCKCKVLEGEVEMVVNHALEDYEVERGYVLLCQSFPVTDKIVMEYDQ